ncbi:hypothetical protein AGRA3207_001103 [Actinomadura graeca]|uniref:AAA+ ATPase domain-containing protein n=1 Tax=Actinomadura graeca TaxID=2750812 RepID=A0ABX8QNR1_9ACTN|nr:hypothetical protein [Actinomadura graeca]QXJ20398.1 hypothetical protein AGRA3207_001103 [Actinomadura graeca]
MGHGPRRKRSPDEPAPFASLRDRVPDLAELDEATVAAITVEDMREFTRSVPPGLTRRMLRVVRLGDSKRISPHSLKLLLRTLQSGESGRRDRLRLMVGAFYFWGFGNLDLLDADDCARLLTASTAPEALGRAPLLRQALGWDAPESILRWSLVRVVEDDRPLAPVALGLLAAEPAGHAPGAEAAWAVFQKENPRLPEQTIDLRHLQELARTPPAPDERRGHVTPDSGRPALDELAARLCRLDGRLTDGAEAADRIAACLRAGQRPGEGELPLVGDVIGELERAREQAEDVFPGSGDAELPALAKMAQEALDSAKQESRIRLLRRVDGPESVAGLLAEMRDLVGAGGGEGLAALAELIEVVALEEDSRALEVAEKARRELPGRFRRLVDLALMSRVTIAEPAGAPDEGEADRDDDPGDEAGDPGGSDPVPAPGLDDSPEEPEYAGPPGGDVAEPETPADDEEELAGLDAFLAQAVPGDGPGPAREEPDAGRPPHAEPEPPAPVEPRQPPEPQVPTDPPAPVRAVSLPVILVDPDQAVSAGRPDDAAERLPDGLPEAEVAALRAGRFGLAAWLREAAGRPAAEVGARRCAALAAEMSVFAGPLSAEFAEAAGGLDAKSLAGDPAGGVLAWAAAIRAGLIHPTPESTRLVEGLDVVVSGHRVLQECGEAFTQAARGGVYLSPGMGSWIRGAAGSDEARRAVVREAARLIEEEPFRKIKYQRATEVWKTLVEKGGRIRVLLELAACDDPAGADEAAAEAVRLRSGVGIDKLIDDTDAAIIGRGKKGKEIIAGARAQLQTKIGSALDTVARWAAAVKETGEGGHGARDWRAVPLGQLRETVAGRRARVDRALEELAADADQPLPAAVEAARVLLTGAFGLVDGAPLPDQEPRVAHVLNRDLLLAGEVPLDPRTWEPRATPPVEALGAVALAGAPDWEAAFEARAARMDHEGTGAVLTVLQAADPGAVDRLQARRDDLVRSAREVRDRRVEEARDLIARSLRDGLLTEDQVRGTEETLRPLTAHRHDFDRIGGELDGLMATLAEQRRTAIGRERARLAEQAPALDPADLERIGKHVDDGDLTTAREFLAQLKAGNQLPDKPAENDFGRFYPAFPEVFARLARRSGSRARRQETSEYISELKSALAVGRDVGDRDLETVLAGAGVSIPGLRNASRQVASEGLRHWRACGQGHKSAGNLRSSITAILKMIGLEGEQSAADTAPDRLWIDLDRVHHVGSDGALLPAFGTRMSPSGDRLRLLLVWRRPAPRQLVELLKGQPESQTVLVCYFGVLSADDRAQLALAARGRPAPVAGVLDDAAIGYLACHPENWTATVAVMAPFTATNPYTPAGDVPDEMFYGRDAQVREVTDRNGSSFVYGGRQLGKSALLRKAERGIRDTDPHRTVILENIQTVGKVPSNSLWPRLADRLAKAGVVRPGLMRRGQVIEAVREWTAADPHRQLLILLDEADRFLNQDADQGRFESVTALRDLMSATDRRVKVVWAGLHQTARFLSLPNQPLAHLGTPIAVGPLDPQDAFDLLVRPLATLGFLFPETLAARVIAEANNAPALVQLFAEKLLARLRDTSATARHLPYQITREDVNGVWRDKKLARGFRDRFEWTLNLDKRYKVIAYTVALHALAEGAAATLSVDELRAECGDWWPDGFRDCTSDGFRGLLDECVNLGVLGVDTDRYRLRTPHILNLLGGVREVENVLQNTEDFEPPDQFDAHSYRMPFHSGPERSPLSIGQLARLLRARPPIHVVVGSLAMHAERVAASLKNEETTQPDLRVWLVRAGELSLDSALRGAAANRGHSVIILDLLSGHDTGTFERRLIEAEKGVATHPGRGLSIVLVAGPMLAPAWVRIETREGIELVGLRRYDLPAIRQWMWEDALGFPDDAGQRELVARTGGWPTLVGRVVTSLTRHGGDRDQALGRCLEQVWSRPERMLGDAGVRGEERLAAAWRVLVAHDEPETPEDLAALLAAHGEETTPELALDALHACGYAGPRDLVEALRVLGVLVPAGGRLACEPVLAEATRRAEGR